MRLERLRSALYGEQVPHARRQTPPPHAQDNFQVEDIVQVTLDSDGVWRAVSSAPPEHNVPRSPSVVLRQASLVGPAACRIYSPRGTSQVIHQGKGQQLDTYV